MIFSVSRGETPSAGKHTDGCRDRPFIIPGKLEIFFSLEKVFLKPSSLKRDKTCPEEWKKTREEIEENNNQEKKAQKQVFNNRFARFALGYENNNQKEDGFIGNPDSVADMNPDFFVSQE
jgi:hypothetical protein